MYESEQNYISKTLFWFVKKKKEKEKTFPVCFWKMFKKIRNFFLFYEETKNKSRILLAMELSERNFPLRIPAIFWGKFLKIFLKILENLSENSWIISWIFTDFSLEILKILSGISLLQLGLHISAWNMSLINKVLCNRQSEILTSCLHFLYVETFPILETCENVKSGELFYSVKKKPLCVCFICKTEWDKHQVNVFVLRKKKQNISRILFSVKNKRKEQF